MGTNVRTAPWCLYYTLEHISDVSKPPEITRRVIRGHAQSHAQAHNTLGPSGTHPAIAGSSHLRTEIAPQTLSRWPKPQCQSCRYRWARLRANIARYWLSEWPGAVAGGSGTCAFSRSGSARPAEDTEESGAPRREIALKMRPRPPIPCPRSSWPTTVRLDDFLLSARR